MKNISVKIVVLLTGLVIGVNATGASDLPDCPSDSNVRWHDCFGTFAYPNGDKYVGEWKNNQQNGQGTYTYGNGWEYVGEWKDGKKDGQGTTRYGPPCNHGKDDDYDDDDFDFDFGCILRSRWEYVGEYKDGLRNGQGTYTHKKDKYVGEWKNSNRDGQGVAT